MDFLFLRRFGPLSGHDLHLSMIREHTQDTPHSVRVLQASDQPNTETSTWQHTTLTTNIHAPGGIRTHNPSNRAAVDLRLRPRGHCNRLDCAFSLLKTKWNKTLSWFRCARGSVWSGAFCIELGVSQNLLTVLPRHSSYAQILPAAKITPIMFDYFKFNYYLLQRSNIFS